MHDRKQILLAEDDLNLGQVLSEYLALKGFEASLCRDGVEAWDRFQTHRPDLCILDVMMPREDGFTLARRIRDVDTQVPIIFLTAKNLQEDRIEGFMLGGDDYLTKPFSMQELLLRMQAILRRINGAAPVTDRKSGEMHIGPMQFHPVTRKLFRQGEEINLTNKEAQLLLLLARRQNRTLPRREALHQIWGDDSFYNTRSMDVYIAKLRKLLQPVEGVQIMTVHGEGFKLIVDASMANDPNDPNDQ